MSVVSYQTIRLSRGKHSSPEEGACVMEMASMLAEEPFSDHPVSVCPVLGSFLRAYNDSIGDLRRQDLYAYASRIVGSRAGLAVQRRRAERLIEFSLELHQRGWRRFIPSARAATRRLRGDHSFQFVGTNAAHAIGRHTDDTHRRVLALLDELLDLGGEGDATAAVRPGPDELAPASDGARIVGA